jgi:uncharacterized protein with von Willebrand factor type A (vWA) domain
MTDFALWWYFGRRLPRRTVAREARDYPVSATGDWQEALAFNPSLNDLDQSLGQEVGGQPVSDAFWLLYQPEGEVRDDPPPGLEGLAALQRRAQEAPQWNQVRASTCGDLLSSALTAPAWADFLRNLPDEVKEALQAAGAAANAVEQAAQAHDEAEEALEQAEGASERASAQQALEQAEQALAEAEASARLAGEAAEQAVEQRPASVTKAAEDALRDGAQQAAAQAQFGDGFSLAAGGAPGSRDPTLFRAAMELLAAHPHLKRQLHLLGWQRQLRTAPSRRAGVGHRRPVGVRPRPLDPTTLLPTERLALGMPGGTPAHIEAMERLTNGALRHWRQEGDEPQGHGPVVLLTDQSGSMHGPNAMLALLLEWAILERCVRERRAFASIPFSGTGQFNLWEPPGQRGQVDPQAVLDHLRSNYGGGTEPYGPLSAALDYIAQSPEHRRADILMLTDGAFGHPRANFLEKLQAERRRRPLQVLVVTLGQRGVQLDWANQVWSVNDLVAERDVITKAMGRIF